MYYTRTIGKSLSPGDPIDVNSGSFYCTMPLIDLGGPLALRYTIFYHSGQQNSRAFGIRWDHNIPYASRLGGGGNWLLDVKSFNEGDNRFRFQNTNGTWWVWDRGGPKYTVQETGGSETNGFYYLTDPSVERVYCFEKIRSHPVGVHARLRRLTDRNGNMIDYLYADLTNSYPYRIEDGLGRFLDLTYESNRVVRVTDPAGRSVSMTYEGTALSTVTDLSGGVHRFSYEGGHLLTQWQRPRGNVPFVNDFVNTNVAFASGDRVLTQTDAYGNALAFSYASNQFATVIDLPGTGTVTVTSMYEDGPPTAVRDPDGRHYTFSVDLNERIKSMMDRPGDRIALGYDTNSGRLATATNALGRALRFEYLQQVQIFTNTINNDVWTSAFVKVASVLQPDGSTEGFAYDDRGNTVAHTNGAGAVTRFAYDATGRLTNTVNAAGGAQGTAWTPAGVRLSVTDPETGIETFEYDALFRVTNTIHADGQTTGIRYDEAGRVAATRDEAGRETVFAYDANGNVVSIAGPDGHATGLGYDLMDRLFATTNRDGAVQSRTFDENGRVATETDATGLVRTYGYRGNGFLESETVAGRTWRYERSLEGELTAIVTPTGRRSGMGWNAAGFTTGATNPLGGVTRTQRDELNRVTSTVDPLGRTNSLRYDAAGLVTGLVWSGMGEFRYRYNGLGLIEQLADPRGQDWGFAYSPQGRRISSTDPLHRTWTFSYDARGRVAVETAPDGATVTNGYDAAGNLTRRRHSDGPDLNWTYDAMDRLSAADGLVFQRDAAGRITNSVQRGRAFAATYDAGGRLVGATYNGGAVAVTYRYDSARGLLTNVTDSVSGAGVDFVYDDDNRLTGLRRANGVQATFTWDAADRMTRIQDGTVLDLQYAYDLGGQVTQAVVQTPIEPAAQLTGVTDAFLFDAADQSVAAGYSNDARGRVTTAPGFAFGWDGASRLIRVNTTELSYDGRHALAARIDGGRTNLFFYNHGLAGTPIVAEQDGATGTFTRYYVWTPDGSLLYFIDAAAGLKPRYPHFDLTGSTLALTDEGGQVTDRYAYDPHGRLLRHEGVSPQPFTYAGRFGVRMEGAGGTLYHARARYYDARAARFLSREPLWPRLDSAPALNPYAYAGGNPVSRVDSTGLAEENPLLRDFKKMREDQANTELLRQVDSRKLEDLEKSTGLLVGAALHSPEARATLDPETVAWMEKAQAPIDALRRRLNVHAFNLELQRLRMLQFLGRNREAIRKLLGLLERQLWDAELKDWQRRKDQRESFNDRIQAATREVLDSMETGEWHRGERFLEEVDKLKVERHAATQPATELNSLRSQVHNLRMMADPRKLGLQ